MDGGLWFGLEGVVLVCCERVEVNEEGLVTNDEMKDSIEGIDWEVKSNEDYSVRIQTYIHRFEYKTAL